MRPSPSSSPSSSPTPNPSPNPSPSPSPGNLPALAYVRAYPQLICSATATEVVWCDGTRMPFDDGKRDKSFEQKLDDADLEDQLSQPYAKGPFTPAPADHDPGRIRNTAFFSKMYGGTADEVSKHLRSVPWPPSDPQGQLHVTTVNGVDRALALVAAEVEKLSPAIVALVAKPSGGFNFRAVRGTDRLSAHAFGAAVDVGVAVSDYWLWQKPGPDGVLVPKNRMPIEVVDAFERHGFIWGGRWYHYDTMHFEYRPELLVGARSSADPTR